MENSLILSETDGSVVVSMGVRVISGGSLFLWKDVSSAVCMAVTAHAFRFTYRQGLSPFAWQRSCLAITQNNHKAYPSRIC